MHVTSALSNDQLWPYASEVAQLWPTFSNSSLKVPTIAVVDSGIESGRKDFGNRVLARGRPVLASQQLRGRRARARHLRRQHCSRRRRRLRRRFPEREARLARRHRRLGHGPDERRDRRGRLDSREQGPLQHPRRQFLADRLDAVELQVRSARQGGGTSVVQRRRGRHRRRELRRPSSRACSLRRPTTRSSSQSEPTTSPGRFPSATTSPRHGRPTARRSTDFSSPRSRPPAGC